MNPETRRIDGTGVIAGMCESPIRTEAPHLLLLVGGARAGIGESVIRLKAPHLLLLVGGARAGTRTRVQALATLGDNHYTTLASATLRLDRGINGCR